MSKKSVSSASCPTSKKGTSKKVISSRISIVSIKMNESKTPKKSYKKSAKKSPNSPKSPVEKMSIGRVILGEVEPPTIDSSLFETDTIEKTPIEKTPNEKSVERVERVERITYGPYVEKVVKPHSSRYKIAIIEGVTMNVKSGLLKLGVAKCDNSKSWQSGKEDDCWYCWFVGKNELKRCTKANPTAQSAISQALWNWGWKEKPKRDIDTDDVNDYPTRNWIDEVLKNNEKLEQVVVEIGGR